VIRAGAESTTGAIDPGPALSRVLDAPLLERIPGRNWTKADVLVRSVDGVRVAVKDYAPRGVLVRNTLGRFFAAREARALESARGAAGVATLLGRVSPFAFATLWIDASPLARSAYVPESWFDGLEAIVRRLHERGIALGDLHHRDVLVGRDGSPFVVDLATALVLGPRPGPLRRALFERWREQDLVALARMRARAAGRSPEAAVAALGGSASAWHARGRRLKRALDRIRGRSRR
jgi:hypothetical protein